MIRHSVVLLCLWVALAPSPRAAQEVPVVSLGEALRMFAANNLELGGARARLDESAGFARQAGAFPNPVLGASHEPLTGEVRSYSETYFTLSQRLELPGSRGARAAVSEHRSEAALWLLRADSIRLAFEVKRAFLDAALSQQQFGVTERVADVFRAAAVSAGERYAEGDISLYELRRIQVERARYETLLVEADVDVGARQQALALMVAAPNDAPRLAAEALPSEMPPTLPLAGLDGQAVARRPEVAATRAAFEEQEARARLARAERIAAPTVTGGFKRQSDGLRGAFIGLSVPVPLFDRNRGAVDAARAGAQGAEHRLALAEREVEADALRAMEAYSALRRRAGLLTEDQDPAGNAAVDLLGIALVAYDAGDMDLIELLDAAEALHQARTAQGRLVAQLWIAYFDLERALGGFEDAPFTEDDQ